MHFYSTGHWCKHTYEHTHTHLWASPCASDKFVRDLQLAQFFADDLTARDNIQRTGREGKNKKRSRLGLGRVRFTLGQRAISNIQCRSATQKQKTSTAVEGSLRLQQYDKRKADS